MFYIDFDQYDRTFVLYAKTEEEDIALSEGTEKELMELVKSGEAARELEEYLSDTRSDS